MPRLNAEDLAANRRIIDRVALECFTKSGYHGITMRDIAERAKMPLGSLYNYYEDKLELFKSIVLQQSAAFLSPDNKVVQYFLNSKFPNDLESLADSIKDSIGRYEAYFKLMYVDVVEFDGSHIREVFSNLDEKFSAVLKDRFCEIGLLGPKKNIDPSFALISIYMAFYQYFILTKLFGAKNVYGKRSDKQVVNDLIALFSQGIGGMQQ